MRGKASKTRQGRWQYVPTHWDWHYRLNRLEYINGLFYALHPFDGLFYSPNGFDWKRMSRGLPIGNSFFMYDFDIFKNRSMANQYSVFLGTSSGVYRALVTSENSVFSRASQNLPSSPNHQVSMIAGRDFKIEDKFEYYLICAAVIRRPDHQHLQISSYGGDYWTPVCKGYPATEEPAVDMVTNTHSYIITLSGKIYTCSDAYFITWSLNTEPSGVVCFGSSGAWGFAATTNGEFWKVHFVDSRWTKIPSNMGDWMCTALSRSQRSSLIGCFYSQGIRKAGNWATVPEWEDSVNEGFPQDAGRRYLNAYLLATTDENEIMCAAIYDAADRMYKLFRYTQ